MFILQTQIIALLFITGSQRSQASPTGNIGNIFNIWEDVGRALTENLVEQDATQEIEGTGKSGQKHNWDCQAELGYIHKQISLTARLLSDGEKAIQNLKELSADETVLVLGKAGSGKTSLVQFLIKNPKLQSKKPIRAKTGEYIIDDGEKIGTSATESATLYPELVNYNSSITFCDSPGFHDSRSSAHEIVSMDVMKSTVSRFKKVKILLLENYSSLRYGFSKDSFIETLRHLNDFLTDIDRYKNSIALIATKVPQIYYSGEDNPVTVTEVLDEVHIESILEYLNLTEASIRAEKLTQDVSKNDQVFYQKIIELLQSLQTVDEGGKSDRVNIFRQPNKIGPLENMLLLEKNRNSLFRTIVNLDFVEVRENDFDFTLSDEAKLYLECSLKLTSDNYKSKIDEVSLKLNEFVDGKIQNYSSYNQVFSELESLYKALKQLPENLDETRNYNEFFEKIYGFITDHKIPLSINYNERLNVLEKYEEMLSRFVDTSAVFIPVSWTHPIRQVIKSTKDELEWYRTLNKFIGGLSSYEKQKNKTELHSSVFHEGIVSSNGLMTLFMDVTGITDLKQVVDALSNPRKRAEVEEITKTLLMQNKITCDVDGRLIVKGSHVILSEINSDHLLQSFCNNITVKDIGLLAVETVFLDEDTSDVFRGMNMLIMAPRWEVIGQRRIVLSGKPGPEISYWRGMFGFESRKPGLPGSNGGSFSGIGLHFLNGANLYIESNGGRGGPGMDGARGTRGLGGRDGFEMLLELGVYNQSYKFEKGINSHNMSDVLLKNSVEEEIYLLFCDEIPLRATVQVIIEDGECGGVGGPGGFGGEAGIGGFAGEMQLIELGDSSQIKMQNQNGGMGIRGRMGETGDVGTDGIGIICLMVNGLYQDLPRVLNTTYWKCESTNRTSPACKTCPLLDGTIANQHFIQDGIEQPAPKKSPDFIHNVLDYSILLEAYSNNSIFRKITTDFKEGIKRKFSYNNFNEMGLLFFKKSA